MPYDEGGVLSQVFIALNELFISSGISFLLSIEKHLQIVIDDFLSLLDDTPHKFSNEEP